MKSDANDVYDTPEIMFKQFEKDWRQALEIGISKIILRHDDDAGEDDDGDGIPDELQQVGEVLWAYYNVLFLIFVFYTSIDRDMLFMGMNSWNLISSFTFGRETG